MHKPTFTNFTVAALISIASAGLIHAQSEQNLEVDATSYFWLQGIHGDVNALGQNVDFKATPSDLAKDANFGLSGAVFTRYKRLIVINDIQWTPVSINKSGGTALPLPEGSSVKVDYTPVIDTHEAGYRLVDNRRISVDGLAGVRHWHLGTELTLTPPAGGNITKTGSSNWTDPLVGARIQVPLSSKLSATVIGDAGGWGVGSELDYEIIGALSYRVARRWSTDAGWRYLYDDYNPGSLHSRTTQSGLIVGVTYYIK
jgi:hypothetical protein